MENNNNSALEFVEDKKRQKLLEQRLKKIEQLVLENERKINIIEKSLRGRK